MIKTSFLAWILCFSVVASAGSTTAMDPALVNQLHKLNQSKPAKVKIINDANIKQNTSDFSSRELPGLFDRVKDYRHKISSANGFSDKPEDTCYDKKNLGDVNLYVFISSSVPEETLKTYAHDLRRMSTAVMVINGAVGGATKIMPTVNLLTRISCGKNISDLKSATDCTIVRTDINPYLFRTFSISAVPAFVITDKPYSEIMLAASKGEKAPDNSYIKMTGDTQLSYVLEHFRAAGSNEAADLLEMMRDGYYK